MQEPNKMRLISWIAVAVLFAAAATIFAHKFESASPPGHARQHSMAAPLATTAREPWIVDKSPDPAVTSAPAPAPAPLVQLAAMHSQALGPLTRSPDQPNPLDYIYTNPKNAASPGAHVPAI